MRSLCCYISAALLACFAATTDATTDKKFPDYSMVLIGGGLQTCSSSMVRNCTDAGLFSTAAKSADVFMLSAENLANIADKAFWGEQRIIEQQQVLAILEFVRSRIADEQITERELLKLWRSAEIEIDGIWVSGRTNYAALTERERNFILDQLQVMAATDSEAKTASNTRKKEYADLAGTKDGFSVEIYNKIIELAQQVAGPQRKPRLLVVTAADRDPFAAVDLYTNLFKEAGAEVTWLPVNAAYQAAQQHSVNDKASCSELPQYLATYHQAYQRGRVYPDLMQQFERFCKLGSEGAIEQLRRADAIFFAGGDQNLIIQAFKLPDGSATAELKQIKSMLAAGQLIVAGTSASTAVMSGGSYLAHNTPMITSGDSFNAMQFGAFDLPAPQRGCDKDQSCSNGLAENHLTYSGVGGLGLFPWGVLDTHFSERGRQGRLIRLQNDTQTRFGFGIDEATALLVAPGPANSSLQAIMEVMGAGGIYVVDNTHTSSTGEGSAASFTKVTTHYLTHQDKLEINEGSLRTRFAQWKFAPNNNQAPMLTSGDLFERDNYKQLAHLLCLTQSRQADGKAIKLGQGHTVSLYKDASSYARQGVYRMRDIEQQYCSYRNVMLDIQPAN